MLFVVKMGISSFCETQLGMSKAEAKKVSRWIGLGAAVLLCDPSAIVEDVFGEVAQNTIENKVG